MEVKLMSEETKENQESRELSLRRERPFSLFQEMDRMFDDMTRDLSDWFYWPFDRNKWRLSSIKFPEEQRWFRTPLTNISEEKDGFNIKAELPGLDKGDIEINISDGVMEIRGETKDEQKEEKEGKFVRREYQSSSYYRAFNLPENVDEDTIDASFDSGILNIEIPKTEPKEPEKKNIEIK
jgi:HSP20 family protein